MSKLLVVVAHPDDEVLMAGGLIARHVSQGGRLRVVYCCENAARHEAGDIQMPQIAGAMEALGAPLSSVVMLGLPDQGLDSVPLTKLVSRIAPHYEGWEGAQIVTHSMADLNRDHRAVHEAMMVLARPQNGRAQKILAGHVASSTGWWGAQFAPSVFVDISGSLHAKISAMEAYSWELRAAPHARSLEAIRATAVHYGSLVGVNAAEPFELIRQVV
jgi:LmbE family N-acetylglucosaminyl deacetylase